MQLQVLFLQPVCRWLQPVTRTGRGDSSDAHQPKLIHCWVWAFSKSDKEGRTSGQLKWLSLTHLIVLLTTLQAQVGSNGVKLSVFPSLQIPRGVREPRCIWRFSATQRDKGGFDPKPSSPHSCSGTLQSSSVISGLPGVFGSRHPIFLISGPTTPS